MQTELSYVYNLANVSFLKDNVAKVNEANNIFLIFAKMTVNFDDTCYVYHIYEVSPQSFLFSS